MSKAKERSGRIQQERGFWDWQLEAHLGPQRARCLWADGREPWRRVQGSVRPTRAESLAPLHHPPSAPDMLFRPLQWSFPGRFVIYLLPWVSSTRWRTLRG